MSSEIITDRIANLEGSILLKSQNNYKCSRQPCFDRNSWNVKAYYHCNYPDLLRINSPKKHRQSNNDYYQRNNSSDQPERKVVSIISHQIIRESKNLTRCVKQDFTCFNYDK